MLTALLAFAGIALLVTITPGSDTVLLLRTAATAGRRSALLAGAGICTGLLAWGLVTAVGLAAVVTDSAAAHLVLRVAGAGYLCHLGVTALRAATAPVPPDGGGPGVAGWSAYRTGLVTNLLNPKVGAFYVTVLPQFVPASAALAPAVAGFVVLHAGLTAAWAGMLAALVERARGVLARRRVRQALDRITGVVLIGLGVRLALDGP